MLKGTVYFQFGNTEALALALDMLRRTGHRAYPALLLEADGADLASALEIAHACGGTHLDTGGALDEVNAFSAAYGLDACGPGGISIPAHVVAEDMPDSYLAGVSEEVNPAVH
jgi:hypothetical protein